MQTHFKLDVSRSVPLPPLTLYTAWTTGWSTWFAEPNSISMSPRVGAPFHFYVVQRFDDGSVMRRHAHYGRFLELVPCERVSLTWVTAGTSGVETTLTVRLSPGASGAETTVTLTHDGFPTEAARDRHAQAWPLVLEQMEARLQALAPSPRATNVSQVECSGPPNRSLPDATFIPVRSYPDLDAAVAWLCDVLGCRERVRIPGHRVQLTLAENQQVI